MELSSLSHKFSAKNTLDKECLDRTVKFRCPRGKKFKELPGNDSLGPAQAGEQARQLTANEKLEVSV